jgi:hypothetical protein
MWEKHPETASSGDRTPALEVSMNTAILNGLHI